MWTGQPSFSEAIRATRKMPLCTGSMPASALCLPSLNRQNGIPCAKHSVISSKVS